MEMETILKRLTEIEVSVIENLRKNEEFKAKVLEILNSDEMKNIKKHGTILQGEINQSNK
jgi:hypothetical protein